MVKIHPVAVVPLSRQFLRLAHGPLVQLGVDDFQLVAQALRIGKLDRKPKQHENTRADFEHHGRQRCDAQVRQRMHNGQQIQRLIGDQHAQIHAEADC